jgi:8-oxo-dGTP pyrophosphatase MutT (NUDIX family)
VAVIYRDERFLVIRRSAAVVAPRKFCFPGGAIEADETDEEALVRELQEELGVAVTPVRCVWTSVTPWQVELCWWHAELPADVEPAPNPAEVESVHWLTAEEMLELTELLESNRAFLAAVTGGDISLDHTH